MNQESQTYNQSVLSPSHKKFQKRCPLQDGISSVELIRVSGSDIDIVNAARVSFGKVVTEISDRDRNLISFLIKHRHTSPFEHNQLSFRVKAPLFVVRHWMRHRMHSYNEVSYRYVKAPVEFYIPSSWRYQDAQNKQASMGSFENESLHTAYKKSIEQAYQTYETLLDQGVAREIARCVLPLCTYTEFIFTSNLHALMHFLRLRLGAGAQQEIRLYAAALLSLAIDHFPVALNEWSKEHVPTVRDEFTHLFANLAA